MDRPLLTHIRHAGLTLRAIACTVVFAFLGLVTAPAAAAIRTAPAAPPAAAAESDEAQLSKRLIQVRERVLKLIERLERKEDAGNDRAEIKQLEAAIRQLDKAVARNFDDLGKHIKAKKLPEIIQARHEDAVAGYRRDFDQLLTQLQTLLQAGTDSAELEAARSLKNWLASKKLERAHQPFDPNQLPFMPLQPQPGNQPKVTAEQFAAAGLVSSPLAKSAELGSFDYAALADASDPAYLGESAEVKLTAAIRAKAAELNHDPVRIYDWVRNHIEWLPTWGASQDAELTLELRRGNAFDISSLTLALLRASGIPSRYVHGAVDVPIEKFKNWAGGFTDTNAALDFAASGGIPIASVTSGGQITKARVEHIWVEAAVDYFPSRGVINRVADAWIPIDASFKQYEYLKGLDVVALSGINPEQLAEQFAASGSVNEAEGWVQGLDPTLLQNAQTQAQQALEQWLAAHPEATVGDVIGGRKLVVRDYPDLPAGLPNAMVFRGTVYGALPDKLRHHIAFAFGADLFGDLSGGKKYPWAALNNRKVTLSFKPATAADEEALMSLLPEGEITDLSQLPTSIPSYLLSVVPELKIEGETVMTGSPMRLGADLAFAFEVSGNGMSRTYPSPVVAGSYLSIAVVSGGVSTGKLESLKAKLEATKGKLESQDQALIAGLTRDDILGDMFHAGTLGYFAEFQTFSHLAALSQGNHTSLVGSAGTYGYVPEVSYLLGFPRAITTGGAEMDLDRVAFANSVDGKSGNAGFNFTFQLGGLSSALEHAIPEQMFVTPENPGEAVSAVKALQKAAQQGQRIYHITAANQGATLPDIHQNSLAMAEIRQALAAGREVIAHAEPITVPGWSGAGYIILDPLTGDGAYKIGGGMSGGFLYGLFSIERTSGGLDLLAPIISVTDNNLIDILGDVHLVQFTSWLGKIIGKLSKFFDMYGIVSDFNRLIEADCPLMVFFAYAMSVVWLMAASMVLPLEFSLHGGGTAGFVIGFVLMLGFSQIVSGYIADHLIQTCPGYVGQNARQRKHLFWKIYSQDYG